MFLKSKSATRIFLSLFVSAVTLLAACSDDPESTNEEEVITTVIVTLTSTGTTPVTLSWDDTNLNAAVDASEVTVSGALTTNKSYDAVIQLLNKSGDDIIDIGLEVEEEAEDHIFCFTTTGVNIAVAYDDEDSNGNPLGLETIWTTTTSSEGTITITLRHQPDVKTGDCPGAGETDATITFPVQVQSPS